MDSRSGAPLQPAAPPAEDSAPPAEDYQGAWRFTAAPVEACVPQIRHAVRDLLRRRRAPLSDDRVHALLLILSELVTNGVRHAALLTEELGVEVVLYDHWVRLAVEDGHPYRPRALDPDPERQHTGGRGLLLVKATAAEAGGDCRVEPTVAGGKVISVLLPLA